MASITEQIVSLATALGATASGNYTISSAIDLLADTLAGSDQSQQATIAAALGELSGKIAKVPSGTITITENGEDIDVAAYDKATVNVPNPSTGTLTITENGEDIDVSAYAYVTVAVTAATTEDESTPK